MLAVFYDFIQIFIKIYLKKEQNIVIIVIMNSAIISISGYDGTKEYLEIF